MEKNQYDFKLTYTSENLIKPAYLYNCTIIVVKRTLSNPCF